MTDTLAAVPELGPLLGRLAHPAPRGPAILPLDDLRFDLLSALYARRGLALRHHADGKPDLARHQLSREAWLAVWRESAGKVAARVWERLDLELQAAAAEARVPVAVLERLRPDEEERRVTRNRLESAGIPLEQVPPPESSADWEAGLLRAAMALDESWERLEQVIREELGHHAAAVGQVRRWRRPRRPLLVASVAGVALLVLLGLSVGGYLPAPGPLGVLQRWFWSLPWP